MASTGYSVLKSHFDKLIFGGGYPSSSGLEPIRDTYEKAFNISINLFDVYSTTLRIRTNPVDGIISLVGPDKQDMPTGLISSAESIVSVNIFHDIFKGIDKKDGDAYIRNVYNAMNNVVEMDSFYKDDKMARMNPYITFVKCIPFYFTFHHVKESLPSLMNDKVFRDLLDMYIVSGDDADKVLESIKNRKYSTDIEDIYNIMTSNGEVQLFW